jgi:hypothetical protein
MSFKQQILKIIFMCLISLISLLIFFSKSVYSLGADTAHPYIAKEAFWVWPGFPLINPNDRNSKDYSKATDVQKEFDQYINIINKLPQGSRDEDDPRIWEIFSKPYPHIPALWHYYNLQPPCSAVNLVGGTKSAVDWALELFMAQETKKYPSNDASGATSGLQPWDFSWKWRLQNTS